MKLSGGKQSAHDHNYVFAYEDSDLCDILESIVKSSNTKSLIITP